MSSIDVVTTVEVTVGAAFVNVTVILKVSKTVTLPVSVAVTLIANDPISLFVGVPVNVLAAASKVNQLGSAVPSDKLATYDRVSDTSTSEKVVASNLKYMALPLEIVWSGIALATVGASLTLDTTILKVSEASAPPESVAVNLTAIDPTSLLVGVPLKVRVAALNVSHSGKTVSSDKVAA